MKSNELPQDIKQWIGQEIGVSNWLKIDQSMVDQFAHLTGDDQWIHVDSKRAAQEASSRTTIVHGYFLLALIPKLVGQVVTFRNVAQRINCGSNRIRFLRPVTVGSRIRVRVRPLSVESVESSLYRIINEISIESEADTSGPACVAEVITLVVLE